MTGTGGKWLTLLGLGAALAAFTGCEDESVRVNSREVGREVGKAAKDVREGTREAAKDVKNAAQEASQGFKEGIGGSGETTGTEVNEKRERSLDDDRDVQHEEPRR